MTESYPEAGRLNAENKSHKLRYRPSVDPSVRNKKKPFSAQTGPVAT
jgi:hypothetical protein